MAWEKPVDKEAERKTLIEKEQAKAIEKVKASGLPLVAICIPHTGEITMEFAERCWGPLRWNQTKTFNKITFYSKVPSISVGRNNLESNWVGISFLANDFKTSKNSPTFITFSPPIL